MCEPNFGPCWCYDVTVLVDGVALGQYKKCKPVLYLVHEIDLSLLKF